MEAVLTLAQVRAMKLALNNERATLRARLGNLIEEEADLEATERTLKRMGASDDERPKAVGDTFKRPALVLNGEGPKTMRQFIIDAMMQTPVWTDATEVKCVIELAKGEVVPIQKISPILSKMRGVEIVRRGMKIALKERLKEIESSPQGETGGVAPPAPSNGSDKAASLTATGGGT